MTSTGNDIVSLNAINIPRTKQYRFYSKILSTTEKALYKQPEFATIPFENFVWLLWSIKESAYKYQQRIEPNLVFTPIKFTLKQLQLPVGYTFTNFEAGQTEGMGFDNKAAFEGILNFGNDTLYSRTLIYRELIVTVVNNDENFENTCWGIKLIDKSDPHYQSVAVRMFLVNRLSKLFHSAKLIISKNHAGVPIVLKKNVELPIPISLSHHDHLVAYSFQLAGLPWSRLQMSKIYL